MSWAMPPARRPTASIFWAWWSRASLSAIARSAASRRRSCRQAARAARTSRTAQAKTRIPGILHAARADQDECHRAGAQNDRQRRQGPAHGRGAPAGLTRPSGALVLGPALADSR